MNRTLSLATAAWLCLGTTPAWSQHTPGGEVAGGEVAGGEVARDRAAIERAGIQSAEQDRMIRQAASQVMQQYDIAGMAIAITDHGTQRFYNFGVASRDTRQPVSSDTLFELGSISKTFTATLAAWAQAQGRLDPGNSIDTYLPSLRDSPLGKIPVLHLATHTAGGFALQVPEQVGNEQQLIDYWRTWQPRYSPGTRRSYANPSIGLLGRVAAASLGQPFGQALEQGLLPALGLSATFLNVPQDRQGLYAQGYDRQNAAVRLNPGILADEAYALKSSSADLIRFVEANIQAQAPAQDSPPAEALQQALKATHTGYFGFGPAIQALVWEEYAPPLTLDALLAGNASNMALQDQPVTRFTTPRPPQPGTWINKTGSTNGFGGYLAFVPDKRLGIVILANRNYPNADRVRLAYRILSAIDNQPPAKNR